MDTILFSGVGFLLILFALFLSKKHKRFMARSIEVPGEIVDIIERTRVTRGSLGGVTSQRLLKLPLVKYRYNRFYKFESEKDISQDGLKIGSSVTVRIDPLNPKVAKLSIGLTSNSLLFMLMIGLGLFLMVIGGVQYKPGDFNLSLFDDWLTLGFVVVGGIYLSIKVAPIVNLLKYNPLYGENAEEIDD